MKVCLSYCFCLVYCMVGIVLVVLFGKFEFVDIIVLWVDCGNYLLKKGLKLIV